MGYLFLKLVIEAGALDGVWANLAVGYCQMLRMLGIGFQSLWTFEHAVEHDVAV